MMCPKEFTCALFADGELPEVEAREIALHLESCEACDRLITALRGESRMLVQCLQDIDQEAPGEVPEFASAPARSISAVAFAAVIIGIAIAFRICTGLLFGFNVPPELEGLNPREWVLSFGVALNAGFYALQNAGPVMRGVAQGTVFLSLGAALLFGMSRILKRGAATNVVLGTLVAIALVTPSHAIDLRKGAAASIPSTQTVDDTLIAGPDEKVQTIDIAGVIKGDLIIAGDVVVISGTVEGDVIAAARRLEITGTVGGTVFGIAQTLMISGQVARNAITAGDTINVARAASIGGNVITASSRETVFEGTTQRDLISATSILEMRGNVGRHVSFIGGQVSLAGGSQVGGNFSAAVRREENVRVASGAVIAGEKNVRLRVPVRGPSRYLTVRYYVWQVVRVLTLFVTGLILFKLVPALLPTRLVSGTDWLKAGGIGFLALVAMPVGAIIIGITVIGLPIALVSLALYLTGLYFAKIIVAEFVGRQVMKTSGAVSLLAGVLLVVVAINLPWIGGLINFLLILLGMGAIALTIYTHSFRRQIAEL